ncbi:hypothetical protein L9F63_013397, partial [Diploptera punctata]
MTDDGFILVKTKKRNKRACTGRVSAHLQKETDCSVTKAIALRKILQASEEISVSKFLSGILATLDRALNQLGTTTVEEIVCYGLGHIAECVGARYQLSLLLSLKKHFSASTSVYDPRFYSIEIDILKQLAIGRLKVLDMSQVEVLRTLRHLISEIRYVSSDKKLQDSLLMRYILSQFRKYKETDQQLCKAREEMKFMAQSYLCYLQSQKRYEEIHNHYHAKGERSVTETANMLGFKLPHDPK